MAFLDSKMSRDVLKLAGPVVLAMLTQTSINIMDTVMVGWLDPSYSIAGQSALGYSLPLLWLVGGFLSSISVGTLAIAARRYGEGKEGESGGALTNSAFITVLTGAVLSIAGYLAVPYVFPLLNDNESVMAFGIPYSQVRILGVLAMATTISYKSFFDGISQTKVHMWAAIVMNIANITLNYSLIFGIGPFPRLYVYGAGVASLIATYIGLALMVVWSLKGEYMKRFDYYNRKKLNKRVMWDIVRVSMPGGLATIFVMLGFLVFLKIVGQLDALAVNQILRTVPAYTGKAADAVMGFQHALFGASDFHGRIFASDLGLMSIETRPPIYTSATKVVMDIMSLTFMSAMAFGTATATLVSQSMGKGDMALAERYGWESIKLSGLIFGLIGVVTLIFPEPTLRLISRDEAVIEAAIPILQAMAAIESLMAAALVFTQALFGAGNTKFVMWVEIVLHALCLIPLAYLFGITLEGGLFGAWMAVVTYIVLLALIMGWKFREGSWKKIQV
jgi:MATE family multidrug resistance protein